MRRALPVDPVSASPLSRKPADGLRGGASAGPRDQRDQRDQRDPTALGPWGGMWHCRPHTSAEAKEWWNAWCTKPGTGDVVPTVFANLVGLVEEDLDDCPPEGCEDVEQWTLDKAVQSMNELAPVQALVEAVQTSLKGTDFEELLTTLRRLVPSKSLTKLEVPRAMTVPASRGERGDDDSRTWSSVFDMIVFMGIRCMTYTAAGAFLAALTPSEREYFQRLMRNWACADSRSDSDSDSDSDDDDGDDDNDEDDADPGTRYTCIERGIAGWSTRRASANHWLISMK
jgi:hypothetical protein